MTSRSLFPAILLFAFSQRAEAGPLSLIIPDDARAFGFDERLSARSQGPLEPESLAMHPSGLSRFESLPTTVELRGRREFTFRRTRQNPPEVTRVASQGLRLSLAGTIGKSGWRYAFSGAPSERETYLQSRADTSANGDFDTFVLGLQKRLNARETLGLSLSRQQVGLPLDVQSLDLGTVLPDVSRFDGRFKETRAALEWERGLSSPTQLRLRAGVLLSSARLDVPSTTSARFATLGLNTTGVDLGVRLIRASRSGKETVLEANGERRADSSPLRLDDGTILGEGSGRYEQGFLSLYRRGYTARGAWSLGVEHFGGHGRLAFGADTGPLFPSNPLGGLGRANGQADVRYRATLFRAGRIQQVSKNLQLRGALAFGEVAASVRSRTLAFALVPLLGQSSNYDGELGPRLGLIPSLGASFKTGRALFSAQVSQFVPLPERGDGAPSPPPIPGRTRARAFGGTLASVGVQVQF